MMNVFDFKVKNMQDSEVSLSEYAGKIILIVNTASNCGFTPQFDGLEKLYQQYADQGLVILGFPCNQFLAQEPGSDEEISSFCRLQYGVTFPIFSKIDVIGESADPLFIFLSEAAPFTGFELDKESGQKLQGSVQKHYPENLGGNSIKWNFTKFLIARDGAVKSRYEPTVTPDELDPIIKASL